MQHLLNDHKDCPDQRENSHKLNIETKHPILVLTKSQWKLRQQQSEFPKRRKAIVQQILASENRTKSKRAGM